MHCAFVPKSSTLACPIACGPHGGACGAFDESPCSSLPDKLFVPDPVRVHASIRVRVLIRVVVLALFLTLNSRSLAPELMLDLF